MGTDITFLSGLPRTGSTLLTSILNQNKEIHTEGNSALCNLMWDMKVSCLNTEQIHNRPDVPDKLISSIPKIFYKGVEGHIIDKCRSWTIQANMNMIQEYITKTPKVIVMLRPIVDIVKSFVYIRIMNNWVNPEAGLLDENSEPIIRSLEGVKNAKATDEGQFLYLWYDDLISKPKETINNIYDFCGWDKFEHQYDNIINFNSERDDLLRMNGLHDIRQKLEKRKVSVRLSDALHKKALELDEELGTL